MALPALDRKRLVAACSLGLALAQTSAIHAEEELEATHTPDHVEEIEVVGKCLSLDKVNAVKTPTPIINVPQSLSIVTSDQIRDQAFVSLGDVFRYVPGVAVSQGEGHRDAIIIRGSGQEV